MKNLILILVIGLIGSIQSNAGTVLGSSTEELKQISSVLRAKGIREGLLAKRMWIGDDSTRCAAPGVTGSASPFAVIGRKMGDAENPGVIAVAGALASAGYKVEIFDAEVVGYQAILRFDFDFRTDGWMDNASLKSHLIFKKNREWAQKLAQENYCVIDIGNPYNQGVSIFYDMEKSIVFGDSEM